MNQNGDIRLGWVFIFLGLVVLGAILVSATPPTWTIASYDDVNYSLLEDTLYYHNLSENITFSDEISFALDTDKNITWTNASGIFNVSISVVSSWIAIFGDPVGNLTINSSDDNETGFFVVPIQATNVSGGATTVEFNFLINATNDAPNFTILETEYNLTQEVFFSEYINASDEEEQYPLWFNITWNTNCTHAAWSDRTNCSLFYPINLSDTSAEINFTAVNNDAGTYWANVTIVDFGENEACPHDFCNPADYVVNKSLMTVVKFNVLSTLSIDVAECTGAVAEEGTTFSCLVNISTQGEDDSIDISTTSILTNYADSGIANKSWFYGNDTDVVASSNSKTINVSFTADKAEIGNWTINFTADDLNDSVAAVTEQIYINVTRVNNNLSRVSFIENITISIEAETTIYFNATDEDLLIPDKGVFDETIVWGRTITDSEGEDADSLFGAITDGNVADNFSYATIVFTPTSSDVGWYTINISATDVDEEMNSTIFNITISDNSPPIWNQSNYTINLTVAATLEGTTRLRLNLSDTFITDPNEDDTLTFSNTTNFTNFNLTTYGDLNFTPWKQDVGTWEVNITATDQLGLANTTIWIFNITNTNSNPNITNLSYANEAVAVADGATVSINEDQNFDLNLSIRDDDFLITTGKKSIYNETLDVNVTFFNISNEAVVTYLFNFTSQNITGDHESYLVDFTPDGGHVGSYNMTFNVTDASDISDYFSISLIISGQNDAPVLAGVYNQTITNVTPNNEFYMDVNATDEEDGGESDGLLNFTIESKTNGGEFLTIDRATGIIEFTVNSTSLGIWEFNVSVNDTSGKVNSEMFNVSIYGTPIIDSPSAGFIFNLSENTTSLLGFTANHTIADNLTYEFYIDNIAYSDSSTYSYGDLTLRETNASFGNLTNYSWSFIPNFTDETYGLLKNLTLVVYSNNSQVPDVKNANTTVTFKVNITHQNSPVVYDTNHPISSPQQATYGTDIELNLTPFFTDVDADDPYYNQTVNFTVDSNATPSRSIAYEISGLWVLSLSSSVATSESLIINGSDYNISVSTEVDSNDVSGNFQITFTTPSTTTVATAGGGGGGSKVKHYSLKIITPRDVIITPEKNLIQVPFSVENNGQVDLKGINLTSFVRFNNQFSEDITISLADDYIDELKFGQSEDFVMVIRANTQRSGRYKATIYANVSTPKFSDWGDFFIDLRKTNETEAEQLLIFTEKFISENPECIELTELLKEARVYFNEGDYSQSYRLSQQAIEACEEAISANEQVRFGSDAVRDSFYYISFATLVIFFVGFIFYVYKRVRFNKAKVDEYI